MAANMLNKGGLIIFLKSIREDLPLVKSQTPSDHKQVSKPMMERITQVYTWPAHPPKGRDITINKGIYPALCKDETAKNSSLRGPVMTQHYQERNQQTRQDQADIDQRESPPKRHAHGIKIRDDLVKNKQGKKILTLKKDKSLRPDSWMIPERTK